MAAIRPKGTKPELIVFRSLRASKVHFRKHYRVGRINIDVALPSRKRAVFIDGDFWHGWRFGTWMHKLPKAYWQEKIAMNIERDRRQRAMLRRAGWRVLRIWEHQLISPRDREKTLARIVRFIVSGI